MPNVSPSVLQPNALNSVMFLVAMSIQNITFAMNYQVRLL